VENEKAARLRKYRLDIVLIAVLLLLSLSFLLITRFNKREGAVALVEVDGALVGRYPLSVDGVFVLNGGTNVLIIEDGTARLVESHCPDRTCELTGRVRYVGQTIVCLPNRLSVTVTGDTQNGVDFVS
jgi:hypothetical protein